MFAIEDRDRVLELLLESAEDDRGVAAAAITGSLATGGSDRWSDVDLAFAIRGQLGPALDRWTMRLYQEFGALHHWDLPSGSLVYRVFLLPGWLEVDIAFIAEAEFGPRIERRRWWQAEYWISGVRDQVLALASLRLGYPAAHARGAHLLPSQVTAPARGRAGPLARGVRAAARPGRRGDRPGGGAGALRSASGGAAPAHARRTPRGGTARRA
jgi:predicted nucleotidyltransferase